MTRFSTTQWADHLRRAGARADASAPLGVGALEAPFRMALGLAEVALPPAPDAPGEIGLWWARVDDRVDVDAIVGRTAGAGPLLERDLYSAIEVWTDAELSAVHALWWLARRRDRADWRERIEDARDWHVANTQPDNATNRPWAIHVFVQAGTPECTHYAETLLHNCMAMSGRPDPLSAFILRDAADALEEA